MWHVSFCRISGLVCSDWFAGEWIHLSAGENSYKCIHQQQQQQQRWLSVGQLASIASQSRFRSPAPASAAVSFTVEVMRNGKEGGNTFFKSRLFGKHLSQTSLLLGDPREEVERALPSVQGRRAQLKGGAEVREYFRRLNSVTLLQVIFGITVFITNWDFSRFR